MILLRRVAHTLVLNGVVLLGACQCLGVANERPNLVLIVSDDLGWKDLGFHGGEIRTPHLDQLVREGVRLDRFYAHAVCSPTRVALLTGRSPMRFGIVAPLGARRPGIPLDEWLMPQAMKAAGYQTFITGKWHVGSREGELPQLRGFDHFYGFTGGYIDHYRHVSVGNGRPDWQRNGVQVDEDGHETDLLASEALRLLRERDRERPFFLYLPFGAGHDPFQAPDAYVDQYSHIRQRNRQILAGMVTQMDQRIGDILAELDRQGVRDNTLVVYFNDNGAASGAMDNGPLRGRKFGVHDGGIRVAAAMRWPGVLPAGTISQQLMAAQDLFPTLADALGFSPGNTRPFDGDNVWPALESGDVMERKPVVIGSGNSCAAIHGEWKLIRNSINQPNLGETELYRIVADPSEEEDLSEVYPDPVRLLTAAMRPYIEAFLSLPESLRGRGGGVGGRGSRGGGGGFGGGTGAPRGNPWVRILDRDGDREISAAELRSAAESLRHLDQNGDGKVSGNELPTIRPPARGRR